MSKKKISHFDRFISGLLLLGMSVMLLIAVLFYGSIVAENPRLLVIPGFVLIAYVLGWLVEE